MEMYMFLVGPVTNAVIFKNPSGSSRVTNSHNELIFGFYREWGK